MLLGQKLPNFLISKIFFLLTQLSKKLKMMIQIYGIPNCGTCKKACSWFEKENIAYEFINYKENVPSIDTLQTWSEQLGTKAMRNTSGNSYRELKAVRDSYTDADWIKAFAADPMLIKRPLIVKNGLAICAGFRIKEAELKEKLAIL